MSRVLKWRMDALEWECMSSSNHFQDLLGDAKKLRKAAMGPL